MTILCAVLAIIIMMLLFRTIYVNGYTNGVKDFYKKSEDTMQEMQEQQRQINFYLELIKRDKEQKEKEL